MPNPRKRPRMPKLPLQQVTPTHTPPTSAHIKLRPPPRIPSLRTHIPDPIHTPNFTPRHPSPTQQLANSPLSIQSPIQSPRSQTPVLPTPRHPSPTQQPANSPLPIQSPIQSPRPQTPVLPTPHHPSHHSHPYHETPSPNGCSAENTPSDWSGGLFSGHRPLTLITLYPTPPTDRTDITNQLPVETWEKHVGESYDARVRRLSFGVDMVTAGEPVVSSQPPGEDLHQDARIPQEKRKRTLSESVKNDTYRTRRRRRSIPDERHVTQDRYECSQTDDIEPVQASPLGARLSEASGEVFIPETPLPRGSVQKGTPETAVRRCRAPIWDGPITQIPETPIEQLPPREAPVYVVRTAITASVEAPSLKMSSAEGEGEVVTEEREERRMGLLWLDIGGESIRENGDDTRLGEDSDSASTEPPSPTRNENDAIPGRAKVFCRSVRVSIPAGGFRSPSPEPSLTDT